MYHISGKIVGVAPILFNRPIEGEIEPLANQSRKGRVSIEDRIREANDRVYKDENGLYLPGWNFKVCIMDGAKKSGLKIGRSSIVSYLEGVLFPDRRLYFGRSDFDEIHTVWGRRPPRTGGACMVRRPMLREGWEMTFGLTIMDDRIRAEDVRRCIDEAGLLIGLGSWRPEYGRFIIREWRVEDERQSTD